MISSRRNKIFLGISMGMALDGVGHEIGLWLQIPGLCMTACRIMSENSARDAL